MRTIHQLFHAPGNSRLKTIEFDRRPGKLCWYPSAGEDLRHIDFLELEGMNHPAKTTPFLYVHTDIRKPSFLKSAHGIPNNLEIVNISEINMKHPLLDLSENCDFDADENIGKAFLIEFAKKFALNGWRGIVTPVPVIYIIAENLTFLVKCILLHSLQINTLVHIRDGGGSLGGSRVPMNFIYQAAHLLKLKRVLSDSSVEEKWLSPIEDFDLLARHCEKVDRLHRFILGQIKLRLDTEIKSRWQSHPIPSTQFPCEDCPHFPDQRIQYHDWRAVDV